jgi:hypothetical protein
MKNSTKKTLLDLAFDMTKTNLSKGKSYKKTKYANNTKLKPKVKSKNHVIKTPGSTFFHVRGNMSGTAFKNMIDKNEALINDFIESDKTLLKL